MRCTREAWLTQRSLKQNKNERQEHCLVQVGRMVAVRNGGEDVLVKWKGLDYGE